MFNNVYRCLILAMAVLAGASSNASAADKVAAKPAFQRRGLYLHACWNYNYPFAIRTWQARDYHNMFQLLKQLGFNTVMLWPCLEAVPAPISAADREAVGVFRPIIADAQKCGLECWLTTCVATSTPEIAAKPLMERALYAHKIDVRMDHPQEAEAYLRHRAALLAMVNNADGYVLIDGDPGGYPGAKASDFMKVLLADRQTIDRVGTHPKTQKVIPWIWAGWGTKGIWQEPIEPFVVATLEAIKRQMPEPWELLPGRSHEWQGNKRINMKLVEDAGLLGRSTLLFYEAIEFEPSLPAAKLQLADVRDYMKKEKTLLARSRGCFGNVQTPIMVIPNIYFFGRCAQDPRYVDRPDDKILADAARFLGGPPELLTPAWSCLELGLDKLPADLPEKLRAARLVGKPAASLPGGSQRYLDILACQVDSRLRVLQACQHPAKTAEEAATAIAEGTAALVAWWKTHGFSGLTSEGNTPFQWGYVSAGEVAPLKAWCAKNVADPKLVSELAVARIVGRGVLTKPVATARVAELLKR